MHLYRYVPKAGPVASRLLSRASTASPFFSGTQLRGLSTTTSRLTEGITTHNGKDASPPRQGVPYSAAANANGFVFVSGQVAADTTGKYLDNKLSVTEKGHRMMLNAKSVLEAAGSSFDKVVKANMIFTNIDRDYDEFNEVYRQYNQTQSGANQH